MRNFRVSSKARRTFFGITYDSRGEGLRALVLMDKVKRGEISDLKRQVKFILIPSFTYGGKKIRETKFTIDFSYYDIKLNSTIYEESKAKTRQGQIVSTEAYKLRKKLFMFQNPDKIFVETYSS